MPMKTLVVYYTRTGTTRRAALTVARCLNADIEEIQEKADRRGMLGWIKSGYQGAREKTPSILPGKSRPCKYDLVVICTPVWAGKMASPVRSWIQVSGLAGNKKKPARVACVSTSGGDSPGPVFENMQIALGRKLDISLGIREKEICTVKVQEEIEQFVEYLRR